MKTAIVFALLCVTQLAGPGLAMAQDAEGNPTGRSPYRHAYYLFLADAPQGCEACYIPLLVTQESLEEIAKGQPGANSALIITYERDSIWKMDGVVTVAPGTIEAPQRILHLNGQKYRYQEITSSEVLRLFGKPGGAIPISRPYLPNKVAPGASLDDLISDFRMLFRVREWRKDSMTAPKGDATMPPAFLQSELTVRDDGEVRYRVALGCFDRLHWDWKSKCLVSADFEKVFQYSLSPTQLAELRTLLDRQEVKEISDFMNAAPIFDDYNIEISRQEHSQRITVLAFMPSHIELQQHPALTHVICKAKEMERTSSTAMDTPSWCKKLQPMK
jgi:hypothetical protein